MATRSLELELPDELIALLGSPEAAAAKAKEALVDPRPDGPASGPLGPGDAGGDAP
jgi:hypothetical protein